VRIARRLQGPLIRRKGVQIGDGKIFWRLLCYAEVGWSGVKERVEILQASRLQHGAANGKRHTMSTCDRGEVSPNDSGEGPRVASGRSQGPRCRF